MIALCPYSVSFSAMGTSCSIHLYADDDESAQLSILCARAEIERIESRYSRYKSDSDLSRLNSVAAVGGTIEVDDETTGLLDYAFAAHRMSGGLFDITSGILRQAWNFRSDRLPSQESIDRLLPFVGLEKLDWQRPRLHIPVAGMELDFGGLAKEYAVDRSIVMLREAGVRHGLVDLGGDIRSVGPQEDGIPWQIQIRHPSAADRFLSTVELRDAALATSGDYERFIDANGKRYGHILNPRTGWPVEGMCSASVISDSCMLAGTISTIAMLKGRDGPAWLNSIGATHLVTMSTNESISRNWPDADLQLAASI